GAADYTICYYRRRWDKSTQPDTGHGLTNVRLLKTTSAHQPAMKVIATETLLTETLSTETLLTETLFTGR
ncbi:MAG: hypothetical protein LBG96_15225, partial [Tannerella sp.]|nr:hypothetical protein [Tannerella sp.]